MGTRAVVVIRGDAFDTPPKELDTLEIGSDILAQVYCQWDGDPSGLGNVIKEELNKGDVTIVNGFNNSMCIPSHFNGMGCLAAYLVGQLKGDEIGDIYLSPLSAASRDLFPEFTYTLYPKRDEVWIMCEEGSTLIYDGPLKGLPT